MMKHLKKIIVFLLCLICLSGCNPGPVYLNHQDHFANVHMELFDAEVVEAQDDYTCIIKNRKTGEYFLVVTGSYGMSITPIKVNENV